MKTKILIAILVSLLVILVVSPGIPAGNKADERGQGTGGSNAKAPKVEPDVEKLTFIHYESSTPPPWIMERWDDSEDNYMLIAGGIKWPDTIFYQINAAGSELPESNVLTALTSASEEWDDWVDAEIFANPTQTTETDIGRDTNNRIVWADLQEGVIARCHLWYVPPTKTILEFDIEFNTDYEWVIGDGSMDVQNIATHELGHGVGLNDLRPPKTWKLTMYQYSWEGDTGKSDLGNGDTLGIQELYGPGESWDQ